MQIANFFYLGMLPWILFKDDLNIVKNGIPTIRTPIGYISSLRKTFTIDGHLMCLKALDHHNVLKVHITNVVLV